MLEIVDEETRHRGRDVVGRWSLGTKLSGQWLCCGAVVLCRGISLLADSDPEMAPRAQEDAELTPSSALHPKALLTWDVKGLLFTRRLFAMLRESFN